MNCLTISLDWFSDPGGAAAGDHLPLTAGHMIRDGGLSLAVVGDDDVVMPRVIVQPAHQPQNDPNEMGSKPTKGSS